MVKYYKTDDRKIHEEEMIQNGVWIQMVNPSVAEGQMVADALGVDIEDVLAALDEEESSRIELQDGYTLILVDIPSMRSAMKRNPIRQSLLELLLHRTRSLPSARKIHRCCRPF